MPKNTDKIKLLMTGGHAATTAIAVIQEIKNQNKEWELHWIGSKQAFEKGDIPPIEHSVFPELGVSIHTIKTGKLSTVNRVGSIISVFKLPLGFLQALILIVKIKPNLVLSFGGYSAFPVILASWVSKIPIIIHEQTVAVGRANKYSALFAKKIAIARETSKKFFNSDKTIVTGNPLMRGIMEVSVKNSISTPPNILILGGSRGSKIINSNIKSILEKLVKEFNVEHITGPVDYAEYKKLENKFTKEQKRYQVYKQINPLKIHDLYQKADIIIARAGANTVFEIMFTKRPTIFIPLPFSYQNEQVLNSKMASDFGIATYIEQKDLTSERLLEYIYNMQNNWENMINKVKDKVTPDIYASKKIVDLIGNQLNKSNNH